MSTLYRANVANTQLGKLLYVSHSTISRIRSGERLPSIFLMRRIERVLGWNTVDQIVAYEAGTACYAREFETVLGKKYGHTNDVVSSA